MNELQGSCHCGRVRVTMPADSVGVIACHCGDCQKLHGNFFALLATDAARVVWEGAEHIRWYASSAANERGFCDHCGSRLAKRPVAGARVMVSAGLFPEDLDRRIIKHLWEDHIPAWYRAEKTEP